MTDSLQQAEQLLSELEQLLSQIRYVKKGDIILSEDHNKQTEAIKKLRDITRQLKASIALPPEPDYSSYRYVKTEAFIASFPDVTYWAFSGAGIDYLGGNLISPKYFFYGRTTAGDFHYYATVWYITIPDLAIKRVDQGTNEVYISMGVTDKHITRPTNKYFCAWRYDGAYVRVLNRDLQVLLEVDLAEMKNSLLVTGFDRGLWTDYCLTTDGKYFIVAAMGATVGPPVDICLLVDLYEAY